MAQSYPLAWEKSPKADMHPRVIDMPEIDVSPEEEAMDAMDRARDRSSWGMWLKRWLPPNIEIF